MTSWDDLDDLQQLVMEFASGHLAVWQLCQPVELADGSAAAVDLQDAQVAVGQLLRLGLIGKYTRSSNGSLGLVEPEGLLTTIELWLPPNPGHVEAAVYLTEDGVSVWEQRS